MYVAIKFRRHGIGEALVCPLLKDAPRTFRVVRLKTDTKAAATFYVRLGFIAIEDETASHEKKYCDAEAAPKSAIKPFDQRGTS